MHEIVKVENLRKGYSGQLALNGVSFSMEEGRVLGVLGPNGSGKTTLIKLLVGLLHPDSGEILIEGMEPGPKMKALVAYLPDRSYLAKNLKISETIALFSRFYDNFSTEKAYELLEFMKLDKDARVGSLSKGMSEKLHLLLVLSRKASLYVLDEPIAGVDPVARDQILDAIIRTVDEGSTMLITTHLVRDMERSFDDVLMLSEGTTILEGEADQLRAEKQMSIDSLYKEIFS